VIYQNFSNGPQHVVLKGVPLTTVPVYLDGLGRNCFRNTIGVENIINYAGFKQIHRRKMKNQFDDVNNSSATKVDRHLLTSTYCSVLLHDELSWSSQNFFGNF